MTQEQIIDAAKKANGYILYAKTKAPIFSEGFIAGANWALESQWIPVSERLPDMMEGKYFSENVWVIYESGGKMNRGVMCYGWVGEADTEGNAWSNCYGKVDETDPEWDDDYNVISWQPFPKLPES